MIPPCADKCAKSYKRVQYADRRSLEGYKAIYLFPDDRVMKIKQMQIDIMLNGPVVTRSQAPLHFRTFFENGNNSDAIYNETEYKNDAEEERSHVVKIVGWGQVNEIPYWICANSWGTSWGKNGFFKIIRGKSLLEIESEVLIPYYKLPITWSRRTITTTSTATTTTTTSKLHRFTYYYLCAKMVTIAKSIFLLAVIIIL